MKEMTFNGTADIQWARAERRIEELMHWAKLRKRLASSVKRQLKLARESSKAMHE